MDLKYRRFFHYKKIDFKKGHLIKPVIFIQYTYYGVIIVCSC